MNRQDDPAFDGDIVFLRRIPPHHDRVQWFDGTPFPSSQNFRDPRDELSVFIETETTPATALAGHVGYGIVEITARQIRDAFAEFEREVVICRDDLNPANGHVLICGRATQGVSRRLRECAQWLAGFWPERDL